MQQSMDVNSPNGPSVVPPQASGMREPQEKLDPRARRVWFINEIFGTLVTSAFIFGITYGLYRVFDIHIAWVIVPTGLMALRGLVWSWLGPELDFRQWRFEIREDEVDLLHGIFVRTRQIVPMSRIQHVDTTRGLLQRRYGLASVVFYTAAGSMMIPALSAERAAEVRDQIAALAKVHDDL